MPTPREQYLEEPFPENFPNMPTSSYFCKPTTPLPALPSHLHQKLRTFVMAGSPIDVAKKWQDGFLSPDAPPGCVDNFPYILRDCRERSSQVGAGNEAPSVYRKSITEGGKTNRVLFLNTANCHKPGSGSKWAVSNQEEDIARRTNLVECLESTDPESGMQSYYPLEGACGIYSPNVVIFKEGLDRGFIPYETWPRSDWTAVSAVSVSPVYRPELVASGEKYFRDEDRALQYEKMKTILRIAALNGHVNIVLDAFGSDNTCPPEDCTGLYRNPVMEVASMWQELLLQDEEFRGWFEAVGFAFSSGGSDWMKYPDFDVEAKFREYFALEI